MPYDPRNIPLARPPISREEYERRYLGTNVVVTGPI